MPINRDNRPTIIYFIEKEKKNVATDDSTDVLHDSQFVVFFFLQRNESERIKTNKNSQRKIIKSQCCLLIEAFDKIK